MKLLVLLLWLTQCACRKDVSIRGVDFANRLFDDGSQLVKLHAGKYERSAPGDFESIELSSVQYFTAPWCGGDCALVEYLVVSGGGSSSAIGQADLYRMKRGKPIREQTFLWDRQVGGWTSGLRLGFDPRTLEFSFAAAHYLGGDAHCCISAVDVVTMKWSGERFVEASRRTELTEEGERQGRRLP